MVGDEEKAIAAGCDDYIAKPIIDSGIVREKILHFLPQYAAQANNLLIRTEGGKGCSRRTESSPATGKEGRRQGEKTGGIAGRRNRCLFSPIVKFDGPGSKEIHLFFLHATKIFSHRTTYKPLSLHKPSADSP